MATANRRDFIRADAIASIAIGSPAVAQGVGLTSVPSDQSPEWHATIDSHSKAQTAYSRYFQEVFKPRWDAWNDAVEAEKARIQSQIDAIPHYRTTLSYETMENGRHFMSTAHRIDVGIAKRFHDREITDDTPDFDRCCKELHHAVIEREAKIAGVRDRATLPELDPSMVAEEDRLTQLRDDAFMAVVNFPAGTMPDLIAKINFLKAEEWDVEHDALLADLTRIEGMA